MLATIGTTIYYNGTICLWGFTIQLEEELYYVGEDQGTWLISKWTFPDNKRVTVEQCTEEAQRSWQGRGGFLQQSESIFKAMQNYVIWISQEFGDKAHCYYLHWRNEAVRWLKIVTYFPHQFKTNRKDMHTFTTGSLVPSLKRREDKLKISKKSLKPDLVQTNKRRENSNIDAYQKRRLLYLKKCTF